MNNNQNTLILISIIVVALIGLVILFFLLKPYVIKYDNTILFTGGLGSGKSLHSVKYAITLLRKNRFFKFKLYNWWTKNFRNPFFKLLNKINHKRIIKGKAKVHKMKDLRKEPKIYSNIPLYYKKSLWSFEREWSERLTTKHVMLLDEIIEYSIVLIDEMPMFVSQHEWDEELVKTNLKEFITFFRHYIGGYFICNAQTEDGIVKEIRSKLNIAIWCYDFKKWFFGLFYTCRMCDMMISENVSTVNTAFIEDNTRLHFGLFPPKNTYDSRCYSPRYQNILNKHKEDNKHKALKTYNVLRLKEYISPLDLKTTEEQKRKMLAKIEKLMDKEQN